MSSFGQRQASEVRLLLGCPYAVMDDHVAHLLSFSQEPGNGISRHCCSSLCDSSLSSRTSRAASFRSSCKSRPHLPTNMSTRN